MRQITPRIWMLVAFFTCLTFSFPVPSAFALRAISIPEADPKLLSGLEEALDIPSELDNPIDSHDPESWVPLLSAIRKYPDPDRAALLKKAEELIGLIEDGPSGIPPEISSELKLHGLASATLLFISEYSQEVAFQRFSEVLDWGIHLMETRDLGSSADEILNALFQFGIPLAARASVTPIEFQRNLRTLEKIQAQVVEQFHPRGLEQFFQSLSVDFQAKNPDQFRSEIRDRFNLWVLSRNGPSMPMVSREEVWVAIERQRQFVPSLEIPHPSKISGRRSDDLAAVLARGKPAAIVPALTLDPLSWGLIQEAKRRRFSVATVYLQAYGRQIHYVVAREPSRVNRIVGLYRELIQKRISLSEYDIQLGLLLGYPSEAVEQFAQQTYSLPKPALGHSNGKRTLREEEGELFPLSGGRVVYTKIVPATSGPHPAAIVLHGYNGDRKDPLVRAVGKEMARQGNAAFLLDIRNNRSGGNQNQSSGTLSKFTSAVWFEDVEILLKALQEDPSIDLETGVRLNGVSFGGLIATHIGAMAVQGDPRFQVRLRNIWNISGPISLIDTFRFYYQRILTEGHPSFNQEFAQQMGSAERALQLWKENGELAGQRYWLDEFLGVNPSEDLKVLNGSIPFLYTVGEKDDLILGPRINGVLSSEWDLVRRFFTTLQRQKQKGLADFLILPGMGHTYSEEALPKITRVAPAYFSGGLEEELPDKLEVLAHAIDQSQVLVIQAAVISQRVGLEELIARVPFSAGKVVLYGKGSVVSQETAGRNRSVILINSDEIVDLAATLAGLEEADRVLFLGEDTQVRFLRQLLPASVEVQSLDPRAGLEEILLLLGIPQSVLDRLNPSGLEEELSRQQAA